MRVLVIEDSDTDYYLIERALGPDFELSRATTLRGGLQVVSSHPPDLVILDLTIEDSQGFDTFQRAHAALTDIPILILSGLDDEELAIRAVSSGAQDYIRKSRLLDYPLDRAARYAVERENLRRQIRESERFANATVDSLTAHIAILNETGTIIAVNAAWKRFGEENGLASERHAVGANYLDVCAHKCGDDDEFAIAAVYGIRSVLNGQQEKFCLEYPCHAPTEQRWFMMTATPFDGAGPTRVVVCHENITSRKMAERMAREQLGLREAVAGMEQVLGVVAHELRTPLAALRAIGEFLLSDGARQTAEAERFLIEMSHEVDRMSDTVNNLLEAARLNSGRARWNWSAVDLPGIIEEAVASMRPLVNAAKVSLVCQIDRPLGPALGDAEAIRRLVINLLSNARKYTAQGRIKVRGRRYANDEGDWLEIVVEDTGCGIASEKLARLGEAFALNSGVVGNNHISGTGMGLAICKGIAAAHGGELRIESAQGRGTTATARIRVDLQAACSGDTVHVSSDQEVAA